MLPAEPRPPEAEGSELLRRGVEALRAAGADPCVSLQPASQQPAVELELQSEALQRVLLELQTAGERYRELYERAPVGYLTLDQEGVVVEGNPCAAELLGVERGALPGLRLEARLAPEQRETLRSHLGEVLSATSPRACELVLLGPDGLRRWVSAQSLAIPPAEASQASGGARCRTVLMDVTRRRSTERALRQERAFAEHLVATARAVVLLLDPEGRILGFNPFLEQLTGRPLEEVCGRDWLEEFVPARDRWRVRAVFQDVLEGRRTPPHVSAIVGREGEERAIDWSASLLRDAEQRVQGLLAIGLDATERLSAERALRRSQARLQSVLDTTPDAIVAFDHAHRIESFNRAAQRLFGWSPEEAQGQPLSVLVPGGLEEELERWPDGEGGGPPVLEREVSGRRKDGGTFPLAISVGERREGDRRGFTAILRDLSERRGLEEALRHSQKLEAVGLLAGGLAHEYKNLLMGIQGFTSMALERLADSPARPYVEEIRAAAGRGSALACQLLAFSRRSRLERVSVRLDPTVAAATRLLRPLLGAQVELDLDLSAPRARVLLEEGAIELILLNLALNARDAMPAGGLLSIRTRVLGSGQEVALSVQDSGTGMDEATQARLFEPFFTTKRRAAGTGLGLVAVRRLATGLGGRIEVVSAPRSGSTFHVILPLTDEAGATSERAPLPESPCAPSPGAPAAGRERPVILIVEDERLVLITVDHYLRRAGYRTLLAGDAQDALRVLEEGTGKPDALLVDVTLPGSDGAAVARELRQRCPGLPVLFMSAVPREQLVASGRVPADAATIEKPFSEVELTTRLGELLRARA